MEEGFCQFDGWMLDENKDERNGGRRTWKEEKEFKAEDI